MTRDLVKLADTSYDLLVIGGGITGACIAWDASLRGLSVALVDKRDFGAATSAASGKVIHGGLRYMQYGNLIRVREFLHERMVFQKIAPQFVHPIPFLIPTYGHFLKGKELLSLGMTLHDLLAFDKRQLRDPEKSIPRHKILSRSETLEIEPGITNEGLTGAVLYYDCQMHNPERLTLSFLLSANEAGANLANYVKVTDFLRKNNSILGVTAVDVLTGEEFDIQANITINAAGPWVQTLLSSINGSRSQIRKRLSKGIHIITRPLTNNCALGLATRHRHAGALLQRGGRHFFIIPWREHSLIGTTNVSFEGNPDDKMVTEQDIEGLLQEINDVYPAAHLKREDVMFFYGGLYPDDIMRDMGNGYQGTRADQIFDHSKIDGLEGLISVIGVKYTTARKLAQKIVDSTFKKLGYKSPECLTDRKPIHGGRIEYFREFLSQEIKRNASTLNKETMHQLIYDYGSAYVMLLEYIDKTPVSSEKLHPDLPIVKAQIIHAVRREMGQKLSDVIFRRTGLGTLGDPGENCLQMCAAIMAKELGWHPRRVQIEMAEVKEAFTPAQ
jgi:glycerol-3-phosphate dehydrogenase